MRQLATSRDMLSIIPEVPENMAASETFRSPLLPARQSSEQIGQTYSPFSMDHID